jgi:hypothetical protein
MRTAAAPPSDAARAIAAMKEEPCSGLSGLAWHETIKPPVSCASVGWIVAGRGASMAGLLVGVLFP